LPDSHDVIRLILNQAKLTKPHRQRNTSNQSKRQCRLAGCRLVENPEGITQTTINHKVKNMKRTFKSLLAAAGLACIGLGSLLTATPAQAVPPICFEQGLTLNNYPLDGNNVPGATHAYRCNNATTGVKPSDARTQTLFSGLQALPANVKTKLKAQNVRYFYFNNRNEANEFFANTAPYSSYPVFAQSTGRCGYTALSPSGLIVSSIYDNCYYDQILNPPLVVVNPSLKRSSYHESGHAFAFALNPSSPRDRTTGFVFLFNGDKTILTPANWSAASGGQAAMTQAQRYSYLCNMFSVTALSNFEKELGANSAGGPSGQVCQTSTLPYATYRPIAKTPTVVAGEKLPYFLTSPELWAEAFLITIDGAASPSNVLPTVDRVIGLNQSPIRSFNCSRAVLESYINLLTPPPATGPFSLAAKGCPTNPGPL